MRFTANGIYRGNTIKEQESKKKPGEKFLAGDALFEIDNRSQDGQYGALEIVPFNVFGKQAENVQTFKLGQQVQISFQISGREYNGRYYSSVKAFGLKAVEQQTESFGTDGRNFGPKPLPANDSDIPF